MTFIVKKVSDRKFVEEVEINTLEDLKKLSEKYDEELIINFEQQTIVVFDGYI